MQLFQLFTLRTGSPGVVTLKTCLPALPELSSCEAFLHLTKQAENTLKPKKHGGNLQNYTRLPKIGESSPAGVFPLGDGRLSSAKQAKY